MGQTTDDELGWSDGQLAARVAGRELPVRLGGQGPVVTVLALPLVGVTRTSVALWGSRAASRPASCHFPVPIR